MLNAPILQPIISSIYLTWKSFSLTKCMQICPKSCNSQRYYKSNTLSNNKKTNFNCNITKGNMLFQIVFFSFLKIYMFSALYMGMWLFSLYSNKRRRYQFHWDFSFLWLLWTFANWFELIVIKEIMIIHLATQDFIYIFEKLFVCSINIH